MSLMASYGQISRINEHLFLSGAAVLRPDRLRQKGITTVVNATIEEPSMYISGVDCLKIRVEDHPQELLGVYFDIVADKIKATKENGGRTLVHCIAGVSRSPSLCIAYLMKYERLTLRQAYRTVKSCRPIVRPNTGFWKQLIEYEKRITGKNSVRMVPVSQDSDVHIPEVYVEEKLYAQQRRSCDAAAPPSSYVYETLRSQNYGLQTGAAGYYSPTANEPSHHQRRMATKQYSSLESPGNGSCFYRLNRRPSTDHHHRTSSLTTLALMSSPIKSRLKVSLLQNVLGSRQQIDPTRLPTLF